MRVKRLEIQGFKSFKDKAVIHFDDGITGIVGPNGCGKSNIVDAFFWVMGEQSYKHMRGNGSDDLIFNGSSKYAPLGFAEATLVLETDLPPTKQPDSQPDNQNLPVHLRSKEVSVTRRLYRSGDGEYFINGVQARLRDIQELFMDTGVGAKGYSVIEQGQIGKIVNAKPEERRLLIEEAAGIAKYKARKKESIRKMEATQANLGRLADVIQEIERNLDSLERQAQKARQHKKYKDELFEKEITWGRRKKQVFQQKQAMLESKKQALDHELLALRSQLQVEENSIEVHQTESLTDVKAAEDLQTKIQHMHDDLVHEQSALDLSKRRQGDLLSQLKSMENEKNELTTLIAAETGNLAQLETEGQDSQHAINEATKKTQTQEELTKRIRQETVAARQKLEETRRELMKDITEGSSINSRSASLLSKIESAKAQVDRIHQNLGALDSKIEQTSEEESSFQQIAEQLEQQKEDLSYEIDKQKSEVKIAAQQLVESERATKEATKQSMQLKSKLQSLEELAAAHEGLSDGPKAALEWSQAQSGASRLFAIADVIELSGELRGESSNEEYTEESITAALEGWLENRLESLFAPANTVANAPTFAMNAIRHLQQSKQGRVNIYLQEDQESGGHHGGAVATFAPSASHSASHLSSHLFSPLLVKAGEIHALLKAAGFEPMGELSRFVSVSSKVDPGLERVAHELIEHVYVVKSFEPLSAWANSWTGAGEVRKLGQWSLVSTEGHALDLSSGSVHLRGGCGSSAAGGASGFMKRKREIVGLQSQVEQAQEASETAESTLRATRTKLESAQERLQELQGEFQELQIKSAAQQRDLHQIRRVLADLKNQHQNIQTELNQTQEEEAQAYAERTKLEVRLAEMLAVRTDLEKRVSEGDAEFNVKELEVRTQEAELQVMKINEVSLRERVGSVKRELEAKKKLIADKQHRLAEIIRMLERASSEKEQFSGGESQLEEKIQDLNKRLSLAREELAVIKDRIEQTREKLDTSLKRTKELHNIGDEKTVASSQLGLELERVSSDLTHLVQNLDEKYGPGCLEREAAVPVQEEMGASIITAEMTAEEELKLGEEVERIRERIRRLGEVNVMAVEEFEELKKRYDYLLGEKSDLEHSIENLKEAIEHINKSSEERFKKAFEAISDRFERLFPIIFGGGQAKLSLVYPEVTATDAGDAATTRSILDTGVDILAQPPGKKIVNMGLLSGGEKALTAVSLIFAIFMVKPSPFCVLDEVDAPLDDANVGKFAVLLREMSSKSQFILITHNKKTMELNDTLYGVTMEEPGVSKMVSIEMH